MVADSPIVALVSAAHSGLTSAKDSGETPADWNCSSGDRATLRRNCSPLRGLDYIILTSNEMQKFKRKYMDTTRTFHVLTIYHILLKANCMHYT